MRNVIIMGAGGRDFHDFNVVYRNDADVEVVAFTGTDWPDVGNIRYPTSLAGSRYPNGIAVFPEEQLADLIVDHSVDEVVLAYAGLSHDDVMHRASVVLAAGANFTLLGPDATMLRATTPVVAVCAARTGSGKSQACRRIGQILLDAGLRVALISHPLSYDGLKERPVQRFATGADIASSDLTIEEREAYERPVEMGMVVFAGVDYCAVVTQAQVEADVIVWDGGSNDLPFVRPDLHVVVVDPARAGEEFRYHPGETNLRMADVILVNKMDTADSACVKRAFAQMTHVNPTAKIVLSTSHVMLEDGLALEIGRAHV